VGPCQASPLISHTQDIDGSSGKGKWYRTRNLNLHASFLRPHLARSFLQAPGRVAQHTSLMYDIIVVVKPHQSNHDLPTNLLLTHLLPVCFPILHSRRSEVTSHLILVLPASCGDFSSSVTYLSLFQGPVITAYLA
jgi:hypothetical protein